MNLEKTISTEYKNLTFDTQRVIKVQEISPTLERELLKAYKKSIRHVESRDNNLKYRGGHGSFYSFAYNRLEKISFTKIEISLFYNILFSKEREHIRGEKSIFLTAMIQAHFDRTKTTEEYSFLFQEVTLPYFGYRLNGPKIRVTGNAGMCLGQYMRSGLIYISGNSDSVAGEFMQGGKIHIRGNVNSHLGNSMKEGTILVEGSALNSAGIQMQGGHITIKKGAEYSCCEKMEGGTFEIDGIVKEFSHEIYGGTIIHNGKKIFSKNTDRFSGEEK